MNKIVNKCLLTDDKYMPTIHLKQSGFTYRDWFLVHSQKTKKKSKIYAGRKYRFYLQK